MSENIDELAELLHQREQLEEERKDLINNKTGEENVKQIREIDKKIEDINFQIHGTRHSNYALRNHEKKLKKIKKMNLLED